MKQTQTPDPALQRRRIVTAISLGIILILCGLLTWALAAELQRIGGTPEDFKSFINSFGVGGRLVAFAIQVLQVVIALIPGEVVEIGLGSAFGAIEGTVICMLGVAVASALVFLLTKQFGIKLVELFFPHKKIDSLRFINSEKGLKRLVFLLFFIPGTPKDLLTYFVGLTRMKLSEFLIISLIARIPSVVSSTIGGNLISDGDFVSAAILFAITGAVSLAGILLYDRIVKRKENQLETTEDPTKAEQ